MRSQNVSHMDLKPKNILLSSKMDPIVKLAGNKDINYLLIYKKMLTHDIIFCQILALHTTWSETQRLHICEGLPCTWHQRLSHRDIIMKRLTSGLWASFSMVSDVIDVAATIVISFSINKDAFRLYFVSLIRCTFPECLFGKAPFHSATMGELEAKIFDTKPVEVGSTRFNQVCFMVYKGWMFFLQIPYGVQISDQCRDLLLGLLRRDPDERMSFEKFFAHPFIDLEHKPSSISLQKAVSALRLIFWIFFSRYTCGQPMCDSSTLWNIFLI